MKIWKEILIIRMRHNSSRKCHHCRKYHFTTWIYWLLETQCPSTAMCSEFRAGKQERTVGIERCHCFSTKGRSFLASKLSGGDYDGDGAWVCWDTAIVDNFVNVAVPECPDLVKEGYVDKISTTYKELVQGHEDPTSIFLRRSFDSIFGVACLVLAFPAKIPPHQKSHFLPHNALH
jgi:hypothetical protein